MRQQMGKRIQRNYELGMRLIARRGLKTLTVLMADKCKS